MFQPLVEMGEQVAGALDGMGVSLSNFVGEIFKALPGIGQLIRAYGNGECHWVPCSARDKLAGRNFGADYKAELAGFVWRH